MCVFRVPDPLWGTLSQPRNQKKERVRKHVTMSMITTHDACMYFYNTCLPVMGKRDNWSWGNYPWLPWPAEELGHDYNNSADTPLATVRKGQTESSAHPCMQRTQGHIKHLSFQNVSRMPVIGVLFQLASKSQTLLTFLGNSCRKRINIYLLCQARASFKEQEKPNNLTRSQTTLEYLPLWW